MNNSIFAQLKSKSTNLTEITNNAEYLTFSKKGKTEWVATGMHSFPKDGKTVEAVKLQDEKGKNYICAAHQLVQSVKASVSNFPVFIVIDYKGEIDTPNGKMKDIAVFIGAE